MTTTIQTISPSLLAALCMGDPDFAEISHLLDRYCPFEALGVSRHEIRHSNFLANILDPSHPHGFEKGFLRTFLDTLFATRGDDLRRLDFHLNDLENVEILREWRHIDLLIILGQETAKQVIAIEIKIESSEHSDQLNRYRKTVEATWPDAKHDFFFLTPQGEYASDETWTALSFKDLLDRIEPTLAELKGDETAKLMLRAYIEMMRRRYVPNEKLEDLARKIWKQHGPTLDYLNNQKPDFIRDISTAIREQRFSEIRLEVKTATNIDIELDQSNNTYLRIAVPSWDVLPDLMCSTWTNTNRILLCEVEFSGKRVHIRMLLGKGEADGRMRIFQKLSQADNIKLEDGAKAKNQFTRLGTRTLLDKNDFENSEDTATMIDAAQKGIIEFLVKQLPEYDLALQK